MLCLAGCAQWFDGGSGWHDGEALSGQYDFDWQLSGDPMVAPLQVFSGAGRTWLQFAPGRTVPALFAKTPTGLQPLPYRRLDPYVIVDGVWPSLILQGGHRTARVDRSTTDTMAAAPADDDPAGSPVLIDVPMSGVVTGDASSTSPLAARAASFDKAATLATFTGSVPVYC